MRRAIRAVVVLALASACRRSEQTSASRADVDADARLGIDAGRAETPRRWPAATHKIGQVVELTNGAVGQCGRGTYTLVGITHQPEHSGTKVHFSWAFKNAARVACDAPPITYLTASGDSFPNSRARPARPPTSPDLTEQIGDTELVPEGVSRILVGIPSGADAKGAVPWLTIDLPEGVTTLTQSRRPPIAVAAPRRPPGPPPPAYPGAVWTFPGVGQTDPAVILANGSTFPAERAAAARVAPDGTTYFETWDPPRVRCLEGASGRVRWEHALPPLEDERGRPRPPMPGDSRMRAVAENGDLIVVKPNEDQYDLVAITAEGKVRWTVPVSREEASARFVSGGERLLAYVTHDTANCGGQDTVMALSPSDGKVLWRFKIDCPSFEGGPSCSARGSLAEPLFRRGEQVLAVTRCSSPVSHKTLSMLNVEGRSLWQRKMAYDTTVFWFKNGRFFVAGSPAVREPNVVQRSVSQEIESASGAALWTSTNDLPAPAEGIWGSRTVLVAIDAAGLRYVSREPRGFPTTLDVAPMFAFDSRGHLVGKAQLPEWETEVIRAGEEPFTPNTASRLSDGSTVLFDQPAGRVARLPAGAAARVH